MILCRSAESAVWDGEMEVHTPKAPAHPRKAPTYLTNRGHNGVHSDWGHCGLVVLQSRDVVNF